MRSDHSAQSPAERNASAGPGTSARRRGRPVYIALFIVLALIAAQTARLGLSGLYAQLGQNETEQWSPGRSRLPESAQIARAAKFYTDSLGYVADSPWALEGAGAMDLARMRISKKPREALASVREAHARFRQALQQRPTSPFLWANLALTKLYLNEIDDELFAALRRAGELGPWEPTVQQTILFVGLARWQDLGPELRQAMLQTIRRGAAREPRKMLEIVKSYTRFDLVCAIEEYKRIAGSDCKNAAQTAKPGAAQTQD